MSRFFFSSVCIRFSRVVNFGLILESNKLLAAFAALTAPGSFSHIGQMVNGLLENLSCFKISIHRPILR